MTEDKEKALNTLLDFQDAMVRYAGSLCKDWHIAQDIAQECLVRAMRYERLGKVKNIKAWAFTVIRNMWIDRVRVDSRRPTTFTIENTKTGGTNESISWYVPNHDNDVVNRHGFGRHTYSTLLSDELLRALRDIPDVYEEAIILSDIEDNTYEEVSKILGIPVGTVRSRIFRGRKLLRTRLSEFQKQS